MEDKAANSINVISKFHYNPSSSAFRRVSFEAVKNYNQTECKKEKDVKLKICNALQISF